MLNSYPDVLTPRQTAEALCISENSVYRLLHQGVIGFKKVGRKILVPKVCVIDFLTSARYTVFHQ